MKPPPSYEGLAAVRLKDKWGYIDKKGDIAINPQFEDAGGFGDGLAPVESERKWGFIRKTGD